MTKGSFDIFLREVEQKDCELIFEWQTAPDIRKFCRHPEAPEWREHQEWFRNKIKDRHCRFYIIMDRLDPVGLMRLDRVKNKFNTYEVSILIARDYQGKGISKRALALIRGLDEHIDLIAQVLPENKVSVHLFKSSGYKKINDTWFVNRAQQRTEET